MPTHCEIKVTANGAAGKFIRHFTHALVRAIYTFNRCITLQASLFGHTLALEGTKKHIEQWLTYLDLYSIQYYSILYTLIRLHASFAYLQTK